MEFSKRHILGGRVPLPPRGLFVMFAVSAARLSFYHVARHPAFAEAPPEPQVIVLLLEPVAHAGAAHACLCGDLRERLCAVRMKPALRLSAS